MSSTTRSTSSSAKYKEAVNDATADAAAADDDDERLAVNDATAEAAAATAAATTAADDERLDDESLQGFLTSNKAERIEFLKRGKEMWQKVQSQSKVEIIDGNINVLYMLLGSADLFIAYIPWKYHSGPKEGQLMKSTDLQEMMEKFSKTMYSHANVSRKMLSTAPDPSYANWTIRRMAENFPEMLLRTESIGKLWNEQMEICNCDVFHYLEGKRVAREIYQGGTKVHQDDQPQIKADIRTTDQIGNPPNGVKTLSFYVQNCDNVDVDHRHTEKCYTDFVKFSQPHGVVVFMTKRCCGNFLGHVLHSSEGGGGTALILTDYSGGTVRPKPLRDLDEQLDCKPAAIVSANKKTTRKRKVKSSDP